MRLDVDLTNLLKPLVANRIWWDTAPDGYIIDQPIIILEQIGGSAQWFVDQSVDSHDNARIQVTVWAKTRLAANDLTAIIERTIAESGFVAEPVGAPMGRYETDLRLFGNQQHFNFWHPKE